MGNTPISSLPIKVSVLIVIYKFLCLTRNPFFKAFFLKKSWKTYNLYQLRISLKCFNILVNSIWFFFDFVLEQLELVATQYFSEK